jgi:hypothetical protein
VVQETLLGSLATQLTLPEHEIVSIYHTRIEHGYPTPHLERNAVLAEALPWLQQYNIWSRGRFGSYKVRSERLSSHMTGHACRGLTARNLNDDTRSKGCWFNVTQHFLQHALCITVAVPFAACHSVPLM